MLKNLTTTRHLSPSDIEEIWLGAVRPDIESVYAPSCLCRWYQSTNWFFDLHELRPVAIILLNGTRPRADGFRNYRNSNDTRST